jgi:hypothetical protein
MPPTWGAGTSKWGTLVGWALNSTDNPEESQREIAHGPKNNMIASQLYDKRETISETFRAVIRTEAPTIPVNIGMLNGLPMTSLNITTTKDDFATMVVAGHEHTDGSDNGAVEAAAHGMTMDGSFGVSLFGFTGVEEATESSCTIECDHAEVPDADGDTAAGENHNPRITISVTAHDGYATAPNNFEITAQRPGTDAQGFKTYTTEATNTKDHSIASAFFAA